MDKQHYRRIVFLTVGLWTLFLIGSLLHQENTSNLSLLPATETLIAGIGDQGAYRLQATYYVCDTSIADTKKGLDKPNQSKVFFHDSTWWMLAIRTSTNKWNLWRYDSSRTWTPVYEFGVSNKDRPDALVENALNKLYVFFSGKSTSSLYKLQYDAMNKSWTLMSSHSVPEVKSIGDNPASFVKAKNGDLWAFMAADTQVIGVKSSDDGVTWGSRIVIIDSLNNSLGLTDAVAFTDSGGYNSIALGVGENTNSNSKFYFLIHRDNAPDTVWIDESHNLQPLGLETADDHIAMTVDKNNTVYMITKTSGGGINTPENTLYILGQGVTVCDTSIDDSKKGLEKPNQTKVFFYDSKWWILALKSSTNKWNLWRYDGNLVWTSVYEFSNSRKDRPDAFLDSTNAKLYVFFSGKSSSSIWTFEYNTSSENWTKIADYAVPTVRSVGDNPASFTVAKNGDFWAFMAADTQLVAIRSSDQGQTWSAPIVIVDTLNVPSGLTDAVPFTSNTGVNYIALGLAENAGTSSRFAFFLHKDGDPDTVWIDESNNVGPIGTERADDHLALAVDRNNNIFMVTKTTGGGTGTPENSLYKRSADSTWQSFILIDGTDWTRPAVVVDGEHDSLYVFGTRESATLGKVLEYKRVKIGEEGTLETVAPTTIIDNGLDVMLNVSVPGRPVYDATELMVIVDNDDQGNVWFRRMSIGTPVACPSLGRWRSYVVIEGTGWTRPGIVVDNQNDSLYVFGTRETAALGKVIEYKRVKFGQENTLQDDLLRTVVIDNGTQDFMNLSLPAHAVHDTTELMVITDNQDQNNVWFRRLSIGTPAPCPSFIDTTIYNFRITRVGDDIRLDWDAVAEADSYVVYRGYTPMFSADTSRLAVVLTNSYTDVGVMGDPSLNHFYMVRAYVGGSGGPLSVRVGEFEYRLLSPPGGTTNNFVALCLRDTSLKMASDFVTRIGATVDLVSRFNESSQGWSSYIPGLSFTDFPLEVNEPYMISVTSEDTLWLVGEVPVGHQYQLVTTVSNSNNNGIMVLMDTDTLRLASELASSVGVSDLVSRWVASSQGWGSYIPGLSFTDFGITFGQPVLVSVTTDTTWPKR